MIDYLHPHATAIPALVELWNACVGDGFPLTERLLRQTLEHDPYYKAEGAWIARDGERIVGWVLSKTMQDAGPEVGRFQGRGGIGALCVHPEYQRRGIGTHLANLAEEYLRANGSPLTLLYYPHHLLPGIPAQCTAAVEFFRARGYGNFRECVDLWRDLDDYEIPAKVLSALEQNPTVQIRPARAAEAPALIAMVEREFPGGWTYSTRGHFARGGAASDMIIAVDAGEIIGFCHTADFRSPWLIASTYWHLLLGECYGGLGPIGLAAQHRKRGLGLALCALAVDDLKQRGVRKMAIDWTTLIEFYGKLGFSVWKHYLHAER